MRYHSHEEFGDADIAVHTLEVKGVPRKLRIRGGDNMLYQFFRENYRDGVVCAHIVPSLNLLEEAMQKRNLFFRKLNFFVEQHQKDNTTRPIVVLGGCYDRKRVDAITYYKGKLQQIDNDIKKIKDREFRFNTGTAFVSFYSVDVLEKIRRDFKRIQDNPNFFLNKSLGINVRHERFKSP